MRKFLYFLQTLDYMRMVLGICILLDGYPLIFFFRDELRLAPGSTMFTAVALAMGLVLMVPFTVLRRLYRPNITMFWMGISFLLFCIAYMYLFNPYPQVTDFTKDMIYFAYVIIFLFLLINIPNDIIRVFVPVVILFTLVSNLALVYALLTNPNWVIGMRATIVLGEGDEASGNPHAFSRNAFMSIIACAIWMVRPQTNFLIRLFCFFSGAFSLAILILTQTRSSVVALIIAVIFFLSFNVRPAQIRTMVKGLFKPVPIITICLGIIGLMFFFRKYYDAYAILYGYVVAFIERNMENVYALLGMKAKGADYKAVLDGSAANRSVSATFLNNVLVGHQYKLILGYGYKYLYLDIPVVEALTNQGILGFILFGGLNAIAVYHSVRVMRTNPNPLNTFLAYFYTLLMVQLFTNGRPYEISFWFPLAMMIRFMGVEHLFPAYLSDRPHLLNEEQYQVVTNGQQTR